MNPLEVDRPALLLQPRVDTPITPAQGLPRQPADGPDQRLVGAALARRVPQRRARPAERRAGAALRHLILLAQVLGRGPLLGGGHHFFLATSWSIFLSSSSSATRSLRRSTSDSSSRTRRPSSTWAVPKRSRQR